VLRAVGVLLLIELPKLLIELPEQLCILSGSGSTNTLEWSERNAVLWRYAPPRNQNPL